MSKFARQQPAPRRPRTRASFPFFRVLGALLCLGLLSTFAYGFTVYLTEAPHFEVRKIIIKGAYVLREEYILAQSGIHKNDNLLQSDVNDIEARVEEIPYVRSCKANRVYPNTMVISIEERTAFATLLHNNHPFEIDSEGVVLREAAPSKPREHDGPFITSVAGLTSVTVGEKLSQPALHEALEAYQALLQTPLADEWTVSEIAATGEDTLLMYCNELPFELRWGRSDYLTQAQRLTLLWRETAGKLPCREYLDLRFDEYLPCL